MRRNYSVRLILAILIFLLCMMPQAALAANIPAKDGYIQDTAKMLTIREIDDLLSAIDDATFSLYVYTVERLEGSSVADLASSVSSEWSLGSKDILLVISDEDHEVFIDAPIGGLLDMSIKKAPEFRGSSNTYTQLIDDYFIPYATDGDFGGGILSLIKKIDALNVQNSTTTNPSTSPSANPSTSPTEEITKKSSNVSPTIAFLVVLLIIVIAIACFQWYRRSSVLKGKNQLMKELEAALGTINHIEEDIDSMVQFSKGESEAYLRSIKDQFYDLLQSITAFSSELEAFSVSAWVTNSTSKRLHTLQQQTQAYTASSSEILNSLKEYQEVESRMTKQLAESYNSLSQASQLLEDQIRKLGYPLEDLKSRCSSIEAVLKRSSDFIEFDPMHVKVLLEHIPEQLATLITDIELVNNQKLALQKLPEQLQATKKKIDLMVEEENLTLVEIKPYAFFDQVDSQLKELSQHIQSGRTSNAAVILQRIQQWIDASLEQITGSVRAREWNGSAIQLVTERLVGYEDHHIAQLEQKLQAIQHDYDTAHWNHIPEQIAGIRSRRNAINQLIPDIIQFNKREVQRYYEAERNLKQILEQLVEMDTMSQQITKLKNELDQTYEQHVQTTRLLSQRYTTSRARMLESGIQSDGRIVGLVSAAEQAMAVLDRLITHTPRNLMKLAADIQNESQVIEQMEQAINAAIQAKRAAEIALEQERARRRRNNTFGGGGGFGGGGSIGGGRSGGGSSWGGGKRSGGGSSWGGGGKRSGGGSSWGGGKRGGGGSKW